MKQELREYLFEVLLERLSHFDEMSEQEWIERNDPKGQEMKMMTLMGRVIIYNET